MAGEHYIIPQGEEYPLINRVIVWFWEVNAIEIANGDFAIPDNVDEDLKDFELNKNMKKSVKDAANQLKKELKDFNKVKDEDIEWKTYEM